MPTIIKFKIDDNKHYSTVVSDKLETVDTDKKWLLDKYGTRLKAFKIVRRYGRQ